MKNNQRQSLGKRGEELAAAFLIRQGYTILARNYRQRYGELDIVAEEGDTLVFVEVKTRRSTRFGSAWEAVTPAKQRQISLLALDFISRRRLHDRKIRFDVVAVSMPRSGRPVVELLRNCFDSQV